MPRIILKRSVYEKEECTNFFAVDNIFDHCVRGRGGGTNCATHWRLRVELLPTFLQIDWFYPVHVRMTSEVFHLVGMKLMHLFVLKDQIIYTRHIWKMWFNLS